ncbi:MAG: hypothetical protein KGQ37_09990 [Hyphomicrobiales bacterium]|nr:hypothetical protein [Hyphomicrobiales bacterium]
MLDILQNAFLAIKRMSEFDELIEQFRQRRAAAQEAADKFSHVISLLEKAKAALNNEQLSALLKSFQPTLSQAFPTEPSRVRGIVSPAEIAGLVKTILREEGRPMKRGQLVAALERQNIPLAGNDKNKNLGTILWRHKNEFVHLERLGYWLADMPLPGIYEP